MKFECDSCHAKYKIADDKVRGRVVRFPCRKCEHKILVDGRGVDVDVTVPAGAAYSFHEVTRKSEPASKFEHEAPTARGRRPSAAARRRPPSVPPRRPASASRKLPPAAVAKSVPSEGQHPGLAPPVPAAAVAASAAKAQAEAPEWHVSIQDVPVGPIRLEEMAHKIDSGAVSEYSLVWREGFDDWRPLATVPELMALLHQRRVSGLPARTSFSSMPPFADGHSSSGSVSAPRFESSGSVSAPRFDSSESSLWSEPSQPSAQVAVERGFDSSPSLGAFSGLPPAPDESVSVPSVPPEPAAATDEPRERISLGVWVLIVAFLVFIGVAGFLAFERYGDAWMTQWLGDAESAQTAKPEPPRAAKAPAPAPASAKEARAEESVPQHDDAPPDPSAEREDDAVVHDAVADEDDGTGADDAVAGEVEPDGADLDEIKTGKDALLVPPPDPAKDGPAIAPARRSSTAARQQARPRVAAAASPDDSLDEEEEKTLREFRSSSNTTPAQISFRGAEKTKSDEPPLDGAGVRATVTANKARLQRCYERAIRGQQSPPAVRLDVTVQVASSGRVKDVSAEGSAPGGLAECVAASVRRWRFPASSEGGPAKFPIVFSAN